MTRFLVAGAVLALSLGGVVLADEKALKELAGTYTVTAAEKDGKTSKKLLELTLTFEKNDLTVRVEGEEKKAKIKVDPAKTPAHIDISPSDGGEAGKTFAGIYKVEKDTLTIVFRETEGDRPKEFTSDGGATLLKLKKK